MPLGDYLTKEIYYNFFRNRAGSENSRPKGDPRHTVSNAERLLMFVCVFFINPVGQVLHLLRRVVSHQENRTLL